MHWPTTSDCVPLGELGWVNSAYLGTASPRCDPTIVWGTSIHTETLEQFVADQRRQTGTMTSIPHVLIRAVVEALHRHPKLNRRVVGKWVYPYNGVHITMPMLETRSGEVNIVYLPNADQLSLADIGRTLWEKAREAAVRTSQEERQRKAKPDLTRYRQVFSRWFQLRWIHRTAKWGFFLTNRFRLPRIAFAEINGTSAFVNYLGFPGAPPMIAYKPSCLPTNSFGVSVTLGASEQKPVVENNEVVIRTVAPLFVRVDHRLVNGYQAAAFISTLRNLLQDPAVLVQPAATPEQKQAA